MQHYGRCGTPIRVIKQRKRIFGLACERGEEDEDARGEDYDLEYDEGLVEGDDDGGDLENETMTEMV